MELDLIGRWDETFYTDGLWFTPQLFKANGEYVGGQGFGGLPLTADVALQIKWQGDCETFYYALNIAVLWRPGGRAAGLNSGERLHQYLRLCEDELLYRSSSASHQNSGNPVLGLRRLHHDAGKFSYSCGKLVEDKLGRWSYLLSAGKAECKAQGQFLGACHHVCQGAGRTFQEPLSRNCTRRFSRTARDLSSSTRQGASTSPSPLPWSARKILIPLSYSERISAKS